MVKILIVEDNPVSAEVMKLTLEKQHYQPVLACSGDEAKECLASMPDIGLVITDIMLPTMSGIDLLREIRALPEWSDVPVIVATATANHDTVLQVAALRCKRILVKPIHTALLLQTVRAALEENGPILDEKTRVLTRVGIDGESYDKLAVAFAALVEEKATIVEQLCQQQGTNPVDTTMTQVLLDLGESAALLGAERLANVLARFRQTDATAKEDVQVEGLYRTLLRELRLLEGALTSTQTEAVAAQ